MSHALEEILSRCGDGSVDSPWQSEPLFELAKYMRGRARSGAEGSLERLHDAAELAVTACLDVLPLEGSWGNYRVSKRIDSTVRALPQEWLEAAHCVAELCAVLDELHFDAQMGWSTDDARGVLDA